MRDLAKHVMVTLHAIAISPHPSLDNPNFNRLRNTAPKCTTKLLMAARIARENYGKLITLGGLSLVAYGAHYETEKVRKLGALYQEHLRKEPEFHQWRWSHMSRQQKEEECHRL